MHHEPAMPAKGMGADMPIRMVRVRQGVAAGTQIQLKGNATVQSWTLFSSREQFEAWSTTDPRRFDNPLLFAHLTREFDLVFNRSDARDLAPTANGDSRVQQPRP